MLVFLLVACFPRQNLIEADTASGADDTAGPERVETRCGDGTDNDDDGDIDCLDSDCLGTRTCSDPGDTGDTDDTGPTSEIDCANGDDDDGDGDTDCLDSDCAGDAACEAPAECWDMESNGDLGFQIATGSAMGNEGQGSCDTANTADTFIHWTAPSTDTFVFDTVGSTADTTLWVVADTCEGTEIACNKDTLGTDSQVSVSLNRGDEIVIAVEAAGSWVLSAWQGECPDYSIGSEPAITGTTAAGTDYTSSICTANPMSAVSFRWVAPSSATWTFSSEGSDFDTLLMLEEDTCGGVEIDCNDDYVSASYGYSLVSTYLNAGEVVAVILGGYEGETGTYVLNISGG